MDPQDPRWMRYSVASAWAVLLALLIVALVFPWPRRSYVEVPPDQSPYLRAVAEPITMVEALSWDDGGSIGLEFKDSKGQQFQICLMDDLDDDHHLQFGSIVPEKGRSLPIAGAEERAFLGLLERWFAQNPDARNWARKLETARKVGMRGSILSGDESPEQRANAIAVGAVLRKLQRRN